MPTSNDALDSVPAADLITITGGRRLGKWNGSGPQHPMELLDKPQKTFDLLKDALGMGPTGKPGDKYIPPTANPDGSLNQGRFETPRDPDAPQVPRGE